MISPDDLRDLLGDELASVDDDELYNLRAMMYEMASVFIKAEIDGLKKDSAMVVQKSKAIYDS